MCAAGQPVSAEMQAPSLSLPLPGCHGPPCIPLPLLCAGCSGTLRTRWWHAWRPGARPSTSASSTTGEQHAAHAVHALLGCHTAWRCWRDALKPGSTPGSPLLPAPRSMKRMNPHWNCQADLGKNTVAAMVGKYACSVWDATVAHLADVGHRYDKQLLHHSVASRRGSRVDHFHLVPFAGCSFAHLCQQLQRDGVLQLLRSSDGTWEVAGSRLQARARPPSGPLPPRRSPPAAADGGDRWVLG